MREARHWSQSLEQTPIMLQFFVSASITWLESAIHGSFLSQSQDFQRELHFSFSFFFILLCLILPLPGHYGRMLLKLAQVNSQACSTCVTPLWPWSSKITVDQQHPGHQSPASHCAKQELFQLGLKFFPQTNPFLSGPIKFIVEFVRQKARKHQFGNLVNGGI